MDWNFTRPFNIRQAKETKTNIIGHSKLTLEHTHTLSLSLAQEWPYNRPQIEKFRIAQHQSRDWRPAAMSNTDGFQILETERAGKIGEKIVNATKPCHGSVVQRQLADISNLPRKPRPTIQAEKSQPVRTTTKEHVDQLQKEKLALEKMLAQRDEIIEKRGIELQMLRANVLKLQEQNQQLAFSNTQVLAELNSSKDQLRVLRHELGCKYGVLKALKMDLEEIKRIKTCQNTHNEVKMREFREEGESSEKGEEYEKPHNTKKRLQSDSSTSSELVQCDGKAEAKRTFVRRQSGRFKQAETKPTENLNETDDTKFLKHLSPDDPVPEDDTIFVKELVKNEDKECNSDLRYDSQELERSYQCRPSRAAARKVHSYKEIAINVKMRRPE